MNYTTSISYHNRKEGFPPEPLKLFNIKETYVKALAVITAVACSACVLFLQSL